jgi:putative endonuclease
MKQPAVYILASRRTGTLYTGVTGDLIKRVWEHKNNLVEGFTKNYSVHDLVYFELHSDMYQAIMREKQIKKWNRAWKIELIEKNNPEWTDLWPSLTGGKGTKVVEGTDSRSPIKAFGDKLRGNDGEESCGNDRQGAGNDGVKEAQ